MIHTAEQVLKKYPLRDSEISIVLEDFFVLIIGLTKK